jgi:hypothetical protein
VAINLLGGWGAETGALREDELFGFAAGIATVEYSAFFMVFLKIVKAGLGAFGSAKCWQVVGYASRTFRIPREAWRAFLVFNAVTGIFIEATPS